MTLPHIPTRTETIRAWKAQGGKVAAVLPIHYPRALLRAFGFLPVEVWGPPGVDASHAAAHLQPYVCSIVGNALSFLLSGGLEVADILVVPHACDSLQGLGSILLDFIRPRQPVFPFYIPRGRRESDLQFLADECRALYRGLSEVTGRSPTDETLMECIYREEEADHLLAEFHRRRSTLPMDNRAFYRLVRAREYLPAEAFADLARQSLEGPKANPRGGVPILLSGIVPEPMALLDAITEMGGVVVADDLACCGRRLYPPGQSPEPFRRMAERILNGPPDPTRGSPIRERLEHLVRTARQNGARGVVFYDVKFCEPELFDLPLLRRGLQEAGLPSIHIEVDLNDPLSHQTLTRIEAFLEMVRTGPKT
ncbi:MAG: 2-hydroxyacyl-CoA dehydratase family protein [Anaerolineae bacterium]|nr:2-hydroxyacyl-CoA dehydratase family protein [Anaerolineae bacterium]MDW7991830.1 2-hydroxyacyl-CoA dehydratase family protein [Anaerolineae bacterium]